MELSSSQIDYTVIDPSKKWQMLRTHYRYAFWGLPSFARFDSAALTKMHLALWTSIGSMMLGLDYVAGGQLASLEKL
ncbi:hypothetical protein V1506DRAFT_547728 [Lipomyces tetrasporus]